MPNWPKRINKERSADLLPDEELIDATFFQGRGTKDALLAFAVKRQFSQRPHDSQQIADGTAAAEGVRSAALAENTAPDGSFAAKIPDDNGVIAVTSKRVIVFDYKQGSFRTKIEDVVLAVPRTEVTHWEFSKGKLSAELALEFSDQSATVLEIPRINKPEAFAKTLGIPFAD